MAKLLLAPETSGFWVVATYAVLFAALLVIVGSAVALFLQLLTFAGGHDDDVDPDDGDDDLPVVADAPVPPPRALLDPPVRPATPLSSVREVRNPQPRMGLSRPTHFSTRAAKGAQRRR